MRIAKRSIVLLSVLFAAPALLAQRASSPVEAPAAKTEKFALTVDNIMRGPDLVGYTPDSLRWSADSQKLYFDWRKPGEDEASTYWVSRDGGTPTKLTDDQKKTIPPANGRWDKARKRVALRRSRRHRDAGRQRNAPMDHENDRRRGQSALGA